MKSSVVREGLLSSFGKFLSRRGHKVVGYDLQGNQYLEKAASGAGERPKRVMEYREELEGRDVHISDYTDGRKVPVQWASWLSFTRNNPPTIEELQQDVQRRAILRDRVGLIDARDREERARQIEDVRQSRLVPPSSTPTPPSATSPVDPAGPSPSNRPPPVGQEPRASPATLSTPPALAFSSSPSPPAGHDPTSPSSHPESNPLPKRPKDDDWAPESWGGKSLRRGE